MALHADHYACTLGLEPAGLEGFNSDDNPERYVETHSIAATLRDAARFVPEIGILAKAMIGEPPLESAEIGFGSFRERVEGGGAMIPRRALTAVPLSISRGLIWLARKVAPDS